jgi:hypothetical protein
MVLNLTSRRGPLRFRLGLVFSHLARFCGGRAVARLAGAALVAMPLLTAVGCSDGVGSNCTEIDGGPDGGVIVICEEEDDAGIDDDCTFFCGVEEECGFRSFDDCVAQACPGGEWLLSFADSCVEAAADCGEAALCTCEARCDNETACFGSSDPECVSDCQSIAEQLPNDAYLESRCVIESPCEDIALCSG